MPFTRVCSKSFTGSVPRLGNRLRVAPMVVGVMAVHMAAFSAFAVEEVAYDNTTTLFPISHGFGTEEGGDQITLAADTGRVVTELELSFLSPIGTAQLIVRMYANDGPISPNAAAGLEPGTLLFESAVLTVPAIDGSGFNIFTVPVPNVEVPDTITWTIQRIDGPGLSVNRYSPPTIGTSSDFIWTHFGGTIWSPNDNADIPDSFYAKVTTAESDPIALLIALITTVMELNLNNGISNSLDAKLDAAFHALDDMNENNDVAAINALGAFINAVQAQSGGKIPIADADALIADTQEIIDLLQAE